MHACTEDLRAFVSASAASAAPADSARRLIAHGRLAKDLRRRRQAGCIAAPARLPGVAAAGAGWRAGTRLLFRPRLGQHLQLLTLAAHTILAVPATAVASGHATFASRGLRLWLGDFLCYGQRCARNGGGLGQGFLEHGLFDGGWRTGGGGIATGEAGDQKKQ